ncbi:rRNA processing/ribosome biogenesis-domain-containing protein [Earliella scabrosa]|nr:rRNA processing/ribosome biogenesis-domain-containing protein [Earliella scabrosa]
MDASHRLKELLQVQLASDTNAVLHLPFVLETLTRQDFLPSAHTQKWIARINSLIHSKDPAARWSGLCLAHQTATFAKDIMLECAQSWVGAAMPLLVNQPPPTAKAAIRLLRLVFSCAMDVPEFQRQLCIPNVPKFVNALIAVVEKDGNSEVYLCALDTLTHIVSLYPSLSRPLHGSLSNLALRRLNGSAPTPTSYEHLEACARLYAVLPLTGGKVNAPNLWRKSLDDTVAFAWGAFLQLRTTCPQASYGNVTRPNPSTDDPAISVPLALDRLRAAVRVIKDLLSTSTSRPVTLPVGSLVRLCSAMLQCSPDEKTEAHVDRATHSLEMSIIPSLWTHACDMLGFVSKAGQHHLTSHLPMLLTHLAYQLEQSRSPVHTLKLLRTVLSLLADGSHLHDNIVASRLARAAMPFLAVILSKRSHSGADDEQGAVQGRSKKGKKRARGYEGDELFKVGREVICLTTTEGEVLVASADVLERLLSRTPVNPPVHSIATRLLLSIYASLPQLPPAILSPDLSLHSRLHAKLQRMCVHLAIGTASTMSKSLGLVLSVSDGTLVEHGDLLVSTEVELLLHPRVPPLVRSLPHVEMLSLFRAEEGEEEKENRKRIGLGVPDEQESGQPAVDDSQTQPSAGRINVPHAQGSLTGQAAKSTGEPLTQELNTMAMQVDVPAAALTTASPRMSSSSAPSSLSHPAGPLGQPTHHATTSIPTTANTLPPPPDLLPSNQVAVFPQSTTTPIPPAINVTPASAPGGEEIDDDDEPMPTIDLRSDSESE